MSSETAILQHYAELKRLRDQARRLWRDGCVSEEDYTRARFELARFRHSNSEILNQKLVTSPVNADLHLLLSMDAVSEKGWSTVRSIRDCVSRVRSSVGPTYVKVVTEDQGDKVLWMLVHRLIELRLSFVLLSVTTPTANAEASLRLWQCFQRNYENRNDETRRDL